MKGILISLIISSTAIAGGGPNEGMTKANEVPAGYKLVKKDAECTDPDPCSDIKKELEKAKKEIADLRKDNADLRKTLADADSPENECPAPRTIIKTKEVKVPVDRVVEKPVEKLVEKTIMPKNIFRVLGAYSQDGIETSSSPNDAYAVDAYTYESIIGGAGYTRFLTDSFGLGVFGMLGGINKTIGLSAEVAF
jgi:hypothetical protein